jgi:hypothetical protein
MYTNDLNELKFEITQTIKNQHQHGVFRIQEVQELVKIKYQKCIAPVKRGGGREM